MGGGSPHDYKERTLEKKNYREEEHNRKGGFPPGPPFLVCKFYVLIRSKIRKLRLKNGR
jgi:hypothetical protein